MTKRVSRFLHGCFLDRSPQLSIGWANARKGRLTYSVLTRIERGEPVDIIDQPLIISSETCTAKGIVNEPVARQAFARLKGVEVEEWGLAISKKDYRFAGSVDGYIPSLKAILEIKQPNKFHRYVKQRGLEQLVWNMWVTGTSLGYYFVYMNDTEYFLTQVYFSKKIWENLYIRALNVLSKRDDFPVPPLPRHVRDTRERFQLPNHSPRIQKPITKENGFWLR